MKNDLHQLSLWLEKNDIISVDIQAIEPKSRGYSPDGIVRFRIKGKERTVQVDMKVTVAPRNIESILSRKLRFDDFLIAAEYITPKAMEMLFKLDIPYIDRQGNFFYTDERDTFIYIKYQRSTLAESEKRRTPKAFSKKGLYLIYRFIRDADLMNQTYEVIENGTGVSKNTISRVFSSLNEEGFLNSGGGRIFFLKSETEALKQEWIKYYDRQLSTGGSIKDDPDLIVKLKEARNDLS